MSFPFVWVFSSVHGGKSRPEERRDHRKGNGQHGLLERAAVDHAARAAKSGVVNTDENPKLQKEDRGDHGSRPAPQQRIDDAGWRC